MTAKLIPELDVAALEQSLAFYVGVIGCELLYERPEERFAYLDLGGARMMLQEAAGPGRRFRTASLEHPYGRGVNFQIEVDDVDALAGRLAAAGVPLILESETRWYRVGAEQRGHRQFVVADPDGYLLRFFSDLGTRLLQP